MLKYKKYFVEILLIVALSILGLFFVFKTANGQMGEIIFSEIAWMGTTNSANDEWIELYNPGSASVIIDDWMLKTQDRSPEIILSGSIGANGYFLLERTDDTSASPTADQIYTGSLKNSGEILRLYNASGVLIDTAGEIDKWPAGDNSTKETMVRILMGPDALSWVNGPIGGTPRSQNLNFTSNTEENSDEPLNTAQKFVRTKAVIINEFLPNPQGADNEGEWIELFNASEESVDLSNWYLDDIDGGSKNYQIPLGVILAPQSYLIFLRKDTGIALNNDADFVRLLYPDKTVAYEIDYTETAKDDVSFALINNSWQWTDNPTPNSKNVAGLIKDNITKKNNRASNGSVIENQKEDTKNTKIMNIQEFSAQISQNENAKSPILLFVLIGILSLAAGVGFIFVKNRFFVQQED